MWREFSEHEAMQALSKYGVFVLTPQRRKLLGNALLNLENDFIDLNTAKIQLKKQILFNKRIIDALNKASADKRNEEIFKLKNLKVRLAEI